ncbi:hypothetical protein [Rhodoblastus sp.]|uniref:hypothetical protein n=1 Tax=Rhodoblastus sp. TaxID=1962975 RepID=UPI0035AF1B03
MEAMRSNGRRPSTIGDFFSLRRVDVERLGRSIWKLTLIVYGVRILFEVFDVLHLWLSLNPTGLAAIAVAFSDMIAVISHLAVSLLWLMIIRLVLEVCFTLINVSRNASGETENAN